MTQRCPFKPHYGTNQSLAAAAASANTPINPIDKSVRIINTGAAIAFFRITQGAVAAVASASDCPINSGQTLIVEKGDGQDTFSYISASGANLQVMTGEGGI